MKKVLGFHLKTKTVLIMSVQYGDTYTDRQLAILITKSLYMNPSKCYPSYTKKQSKKEQ